MGQKTGYKGNCGAEWCWESQPLFLPQFWARFCRGKASGGVSLSPAGHRGDLSVAACPRHPPLGVATCWWPRKGPQRGHLSPSPASKCFSGLVATEGTSVWPPVAVTCLCVCQWVGGHRGDLSVATSGHDPLPGCVTILMAVEGTSVWPPVPVTHLHVCVTRLVAT